MPCVKFGLNCPRVLGKNIFKCSQYIFAYLLLRAWSFIWTNLNPLHLKDTYFQVWWKLSQWFLRRWKCYGQTDDGQQAIRKSHFSFQLGWYNNGQSSFTRACTITHDKNTINHEHRHNRLPTIITFLQWCERDILNYSTETSIIVGDSYNSSM